MSLEWMQLFLTILIKSMNDGGEGDGKLFLLAECSVK